MILDIMSYSDESYRFLFRCSQGHKFYYCANSTDVYNYIIKYNQSHTNMDNFKLNQESIPLASLEESYSHPSAPSSELLKLNSDT